jgi:hypothetical protein
MINELIEKEKYIPGSNSTPFSLQYLNCFYFVCCIHISIPINKSK